MSRIRIEGVPLWVVLFTAFMAITGIAVGLIALADPSVFPFSDGHLSLGRRWAGRNLGLALIAGGAVVLRSRGALVLSLIGGIAREVGDLAAAATDGDSVLPAVLFIAIGIAGLIGISRTSVAQPIADAEVQVR